MTYLHLTPKILPVVHEYYPATVVHDSIHFDTFSPTQMPTEEFNAPWIPQRVESVPFSSTPPRLSTYLQYQQRSPTSTPQPEFNHLCQTVDHIFEELAMRLSQLFASSEFIQFGSPLTIFLHIITKLISLMISLIIICWPHISTPCLVRGRIFGYYHEPSKRLFAVSPLDFFNARQVLILFVKLIEQINDFPSSIFAPTVAKASGTAIIWHELKLSTIWRTIYLNRKNVFIFCPLSPEHFFYPTINTAPFSITYFLIPQITGIKKGYFFTAYQPHIFHLLNHLDQVLMIMLLNQSCSQFQDTQAPQLFSFIPFLSPFHLEKLYSFTFHLNPCLAFTQPTSASSPFLFLPRTITFQPAFQSESLSVVFLSFITTWFDQTQNVTLQFLQLWNAEIQHFAVVLSVNPRKCPEVLSNFSRMSSEVLDPILYFINAMVPARSLHKCFTALAFHFNILLEIITCHRIQDNSAKALQWSSLRAFIHTPQTFSESPTYKLIHSRWLHSRGFYSKYPQSEEAVRQEYDSQNVSHDVNDIQFLDKSEIENTLWNMEIDGNIPTPRLMFFFPSPSPPLFFSLLFFPFLPIIITIARLRFQGFFSFPLGGTYIEINFSN